ncbi:MAG: type IX secretion system sortase PorU [Bacteroidota bacterium]|nr:type IX secretion system sortase PorU [Bacteroidota bacterium]
MQNNYLKFFLFFVLLSVLNTEVFFGQEKTHEISWQDAVNVSFSAKPHQVPGFAPEHFVYAVRSGVRYADKWKTNETFDLKSVRLERVVYETLSPSALKQLRLEQVPESHDLQVEFSGARGTRYFEYSFAPIIQQNGVVKRVKRFTIAYDRIRSTISTQHKNPQRSNSILRSGTFYKFYVDTTGVFKLDYDFLQRLGFNPRTINPQALKIYGDGGAMLPLKNEDNTVFDPQELAIKVVGGEDGSFDREDYILFYGEGTRQFNAESLTHVNAYDDRSYYFITADGTSGLRVQYLVEPGTEATRTITTFRDYQFYERDEYNLLNLGRRWFATRFDVENLQDFEFNFPNRVADAPVDLRVYTAAISESSTSFAVRVNNQPVANLNILPINESVLAREAFYDSYAYPAANSTVTISGDNISVQLEYNNSGNPSSEGYLDFVGIGATRNLLGTGGQLRFDGIAPEIPNEVGLYQLQNASGFTEVWEITDPSTVSAVDNSEASATLTFQTYLNAAKKYVAIHPDDYFEPQIDPENTSVANQDLKGTIFQSSGSFEDVDYLIITNDLLRSQAERLANHNRLYRGLRVKVVALDEIYNEFSSGKQDIGAIRNLVRYVYANASSAENRLKYLCLFGDTSFDYKDRVDRNNNMVPTFNTYYSFSQSQSYMSDDYFGAMDAAEGVIENNSPAGSGGSDRLDIAVGRILADTPMLAKTAVDKIISYDERASFGRWRNNFVLVSDDVDQPWEFEELESTIDALGDQIQQEKPFINVKKIHADSYQQQSSAGGDRYPEVNEAIIDALESGALVMTYLGHGGENTLASEFIFTRENAQNLANGERLPLIVTVTCEFTRFDNPNRVAAGEELFWNDQGGAVGLVATTREISVRLGVLFNEALASNLFSFGTNTIKSVAENLRETKNQINDDNRRVIFFIGDPAMKLAFAKPDIRLTAINDMPITQQIDTLKALSRMKMSGEVVDENGQLLTDYNGKLSATVYDKYINQQTLGNDGVTDANGNLLILDFKTLGAILYRGQASVNDGLFDFEFVVPRDAAIPLGNGRVNFYSVRDGFLEDQAGANEQILVGGLNENAAEDNEGPIINLYMNDENFVSGGITNTSPTLLVKLEDLSGINTAGGIGHDLIAILDGDEENPIILNDFYESDVDNFNIGRALRTLRDLEPGLHTVTVIAWDTYNNSSTADLQFVVAGDEELKLERVLNYPNPFVNYTEFWFNHNRPYEPLEVQVQIFTISGKVVKTINQVVTTTGFLSREITWDGLDDFGQKIGKGVYVYKITVKSTLTNKKVEKFEKLVIL